MSDTNTNTHSASFPPHTIIHDGQAKANLLSLVSTVKRGLTATPDDLSRIEAAIQRCERINPTREPLSSPFLQGKWKLVFTTSRSILGDGRPEFLRPSGDIFQCIDAQKLKARNLEGAPTFSSVDADLTVENKTTVQVQFTQFKIGGVIPVKVPSTSNAGELEITYLDAEMRISRGNRGNTFVLLMQDPDYKL